MLDPERFLGDSREPMASKGMGVIYVKTSGGHELRKSLSKREKENLINRFYVPYDNAAELEAALMLDRFGKCLVIDCHSFSSKPLPHEPNQEPSRPDICLGTDPFHTPANLVEVIEDSFSKAGLTVKQNMPFEGTYVPLKYLRNNSRVSSIMIEVNRKLYMDETTGTKSSNFGEIQRIIASAVKVLIL